MPKDNKIKTSNIFPCGNTRREFVWEMGAGFSGIALTSLLSADGFFSRHTKAAEQNPQNPLKPRNSNYFG